MTDLDVDHLSLLTTIISLWLACHTDVIGESKRTCSAPENELLNSVMAFIA